MIVVCGPSRSGKTFTISQAKQLEPRLHVLSASQILRSLGLPLSQLSPSQAMSNQDRLCEELQRRSLHNDPFAVRDGHLAIETTEGPLPLPDSVLDCLQPAGIAIISEVIDRIVERRAELGRPWQRDEAMNYDIAEKHEAQRQAARLEIPFRTIPSGDGQALLDYLTIVRMKFPGEAPH